MIYIQHQIALVWTLGHDGLSTSPTESRMDVDLDDYIFQQRSPSIQRLAPRGGSFVSPKLKQIV